MRILMPFSPMVLLIICLNGCEQIGQPSEQAVTEPPIQQSGLALIVHPYDTPSRLVERFRPLCDHLSRALGMPVQLEIARSYVDQIRRITRGQADLTYIGPTPFLRAQTSYLSESDPKLKAIAAEVIGGEAAYRSVIVTRSDLPIHQPADLAGKLVAFGAPHSYSSHYVPRVMLMKSGIDLSRLQDYAYLDRHERVALAVLHGDFDAGGLRYGVAAQYLDRTPGLRIVATSPPLPPHLIVARPGLDEDLRKHIQKALLSFAQPSTNGALQIRYRVPNPVDTDQVRRVVDLIERQTTTGEWPW